MDYDEKAELYREGRYQLRDIPQSDTLLWTEDDWVRYIDAHGAWRPVDGDDA